MTQDEIKHKMLSASHKLSEISCAMELRAKELRDNKGTRETVANQDEIWIKDLVNIQDLIFVAFGGWGKK